MYNNCVTLFAYLFAGDHGVPVPSAADPSLAETEAESEVRVVLSRGILGRAPPYEGGGRADGGGGGGRRPSSSSWDGGSMGCMDSWVGMPEEPGLGIWKIQKRVRNAVETASRVTGGD